MRRYGLIGYPLGHSFSKKYFSEKFRTEGPADCWYELYPLDKVEKLADLIAAVPELKGLNVTIPYKETVIPLLDELDPMAEQIGAVNTITIREGKTKGYNTDWWGFYESLKPVLADSHRQALVLGTGGSSKAVCAALDVLGLDYTLVSRTPEAGMLAYDDLSEEVMQAHQVIVNTTPLGMFPDERTFAPISYKHLSEHHLAYDLVYNPEMTMFLQMAKAEGAAVKSGTDMLHLQAEKAWEIWNS